MAGGVFCSNCGAPIDGEPPIADDPAMREPCRSCGSIERTLNLEARGFSFASGRAAATVIPYAETLLAKAQELIARDEFSIAVVVAHMACEISAERAISRAFAQKSIAYLEKSVLDFLSGYNLGNERIRKLYNALTGEQIQDQPFWQAFKTSADRRNDIIHGGKIATRSEAEESFQAASSLVAHLR